MKNHVLCITKLTAKRYKFNADYILLLEMENILHR